MSRGSIYITLDRLETKGYLKSRLAIRRPSAAAARNAITRCVPRAVEALSDSRRALVALWRGLEAKLA